MTVAECKSCGKQSTWYFAVEFFVCPYCGRDEYTILGVEAPETSSPGDFEKQGMDGPSSPADIHYCPECGDPEDF